MKITLKNISLWREYVARQRLLNGILRTAQVKPEETLKSLKQPLQLLYPLYKNRCQKCIRGKKD